MDILNYDNRFLRAMFGNAISRMGDMVDIIAFGILVYKLTGSTLIMGSIFAVNAIPAIIISPFAGVMIDRYDIKKIIIISDLFRSLFVFTTAILYASRNLEVYHLFIFTFAISVFEVFSNNSKELIAPLLINKDNMSKAESSWESFTLLGSLIGTGVAGVIIGLVGIEGALLFDAFSFIISIVIMCTINLPMNVEREKQSNYLTDMNTGFKYLLHNRFIIYITTLTFFSVFSFGAMDVVLPKYCFETLNTDAIGFSLLTLAFSIGNILGAISVGIINSRKMEAELIKYGFLLIAISYFIMSRLNSLIFAATISLFLGIVAAALTVTVMSTLKKSIPLEIMGRIFAMMSAVRLSSRPIGTFVSGIIGEFTSPQDVFLYFSIMLFTVSALSLVYIAYNGINLDKYIGG